MPEFIQDILATINAPWAVALAAILGGLFPVTVKTPPGSPDKTTPFVWSIVKRLFGSSKADGSEVEVIVDDTAFEFASCQSAIRYLAEQADEVENTQLRDDVLDLLRPFAALQFPVKTAGQTK